MNALVFLLLIISPIMFIAGDLALGCIGSERQALLQFKQSLTEPSNRLSSWVSEDCCGWDGVVCDHLTQHIIELNLNSSGLVLLGDEVSHALAELKDLQVLDLHSNNFGGSKIPDFFGSFKSLRYLSLSESNFAGVVPHSLGNLSYLHTLDLGGLEFLRVDSLTWITGLSALQHLDMNTVDLSQVVDLSQYLNSLPSLLTLDLSGCKVVQFSSSLLALHNLSSLLILNLGSNNIRRFPNAIQNMTKLIAFSFSSNDFTGHLPNLFNQLKKLKYLYLFSNFFSGLIPTSFCHLSKLEVLLIQYNQLSGSIPVCFGTLSTLIYLDLGSNQLNGAIPPSLGQLSNLEGLSLSNNSLSGFVLEIHFDKLSNLKFLDLSVNILLINLSSSWIPPFQLHYLNLRSCRVGSRFPLWLQTQKALSTMIISNASLSGPNHIGDLFPRIPSEIEVLDLSNNLISGHIPQNIGDMVPNLTALILSSNILSGAIPTSVCGMRKLGVIDLSNNYLVGDLPQNCWSGSNDIRIIDLASNNLTGSLPGVIGHLSHLNSLRLSKNRFHGELPLEMKICAELSILDLADNGFSGNLPSWIGELSFLKILKLRSNKFEGSLIPQLCNISNLHILDLAQNKFSGIIPPCFENFDGMKRGDNMELISFHGYDNKLKQVVKGRELEYTKTLKFLVNLDLSNNNLVGHIPECLTSLVQLSGINLSSNLLVGGIPNMIGNLRSLESLDFSKNRLSGLIPQSISDLGLVGHLNLSFNNLSGQIPFGHPQAFDSSSYTGNLELCGIPLEKKCSKDNSPEVIDVTPNEEDESFEDGGFYIAMGVGVIMGFWGVCGVLFFK